VGNLLGRGVLNPLGVLPRFGGAFLWRTMLRLCYDPQGLPVPAVQQVLDDRRGICFGGVSLDVCKSRPAEATKDEMDIRIKGWVDGRMCHDARSLNTGWLTV
jgi:hypothetical protein